MDYYLACIYVTSAEGLLGYIYVNTHTHTHTHDIMVEVNMKIISALKKCTGIYLFQQIEGVLVIDPFKNLMALRLVNLVGLQSVV